ncbi:Verru_Chthon cassette protein D [Verrucomicrobium spinosum]|uniref:Verru_Chthon cassette protein D n=1 Tax=Verrucomicrobium spinosum TaxID=2736 RepID=UPI0002D37F67|nr:Verru_Chthon cassette protein D [Verrucomicrobium spinosum]
MNKKLSCAAANKAAFTLIEMMVVIALVAMLVALASFSIGGALSAQQLTSSANRFTNELAFAAQLATRENRMVGVRFLKRAPEVGGTGVSYYQAWQLMVQDRVTGKWKAFSESNLLERSTIMVENSLWSTLLTRPPLVAAAAVDDADTTPPLFAFKPEGGTTLPRGTSDPKWCVTLALATDLEKAPAVLPANFRTLVLNPHTGSLVLY